MTPPIQCPTTAEYEAMLLGHLDEDDATVLEAHLDHCTTCQQRLDKLQVNVRLTAALRSEPVAVEDAHAAHGMDAMVARLEDMARQFTPAGIDLSISGDGLSGADSSSFDSPDLVQMGSYRIVELLGAGGMGLVYLADDQTLQRQVAIKVLRPRLAKHSRAREGFLREARAMASLKHDNVVTVFQVGEALGQGDLPVPFLAMERLEGETLGDWVRREGAVLPSWAARIGQQAAAGLAAAHARGVVHRDIKPGNLWLETPPGWNDLSADKRPPLPAVARVKILDFGLAQPAGEEDSGKGNTVLGTPAYMAPEQAAGREVDCRADLFSLGVVLYEIVTGQLPFPRPHPRSVPTYPTPTPVKECVTGVPPAFSALIHKMIAVDPDARPSCARDVSVDLLTFTRSDGADTLSLAADQTQPIHIAPPRRRWAIRGGIAAALVATAACVWFAIPHRDEQTHNQLIDELPAGPPNDAWVQAVLALPSDRHPGAVVAKLRELNPAFDGQISRLGLTDGKVTEFGISTDEVSDIRPIRALSSLRILTVVGSAPGKGKLTDLSPIQGLPLTMLNVWQNPNLSDISSARGMSLTLFQSGDTAIADITPLTGMPLDLLAVNNCRVKNLTPIPTMTKLRYLRCDGCPIESLQPLLDSKVRELRFSLDRSRGDLEVLNKLPQLTQINGYSAASFRQRNPLPGENVKK